MTKTKNMGFRKKKGKKWSIPNVKMYTVGSKLIGVLSTIIHAFDDSSSFSF